MEQHSTTILSEHKDSFDEDFHARVYVVDSDMEKMTQLTQLPVMQSNYKKGMQHDKVGAKITHCLQPMDVGDFLRLLDLIHITLQLREPTDL